MYYVYVDVYNVIYIDKMYRNTKIVWKAYNTIL